MVSTWNSGTTVQFSAYGNEEDLTDSNDFTFVDFLPNVRKPGGFLSPPTYDCFRTLVDRANEFLRSNRKWKVISCESVEFTSKGDIVNSFTMTYVEYAKLYTSYVRGLRLWLTERKDENEAEQQIGYLNLIPERLEKEGIFTAARFETLDRVIKRYNSMLHSNPLPGRIITIESQEMKLDNFQNLYPDRSNWSVSGNFNKSFLYVIRIFYEIMDYQSEEIGIKDFIPDNISEGGIFALPQYESFSKVVNAASAWCAQQEDFRFCNAQTIEIKAVRGNEVDTRRMSYTESANFSTYYVRVLRIAYTKPFVNSYSAAEKPLPIRELTCRTFQPVQLTTGIQFPPEYENVAATRRRISAWIKAAGVRVLSAETTTYRIMSGGERIQGTEASFSYNIGDRNKYWMFVIRLYIDGTFKEPPPEMLPPLPVLIEKNCCHIL